MGALTNFSKVQLDDNALVFKNTNSNGFDTTLVSAAFGQASTLTIPDPGSATANFLIDKAAATISGIFTFADSKCKNTEGSGTATFNPCGTLNRQVTQVATAANTTETDGHTYTLPANTLSANGKAVRVRAWGQTGATANTKTVKLYLGATVVYTTGAVAANNKDWYLEAVITRTGVGTQTILIIGHFNGALIVASTRATATVDETTALALKTTMQNGNATSADITVNGFEVEALP